MSGIYASDGSMNVTLVGGESVISTYLATATLEPAAALTTSQPMTLAQTWDAAGVTFRGKENVFTITAAASGSTVERWLGGAAGTTVLASIDKSGTLRLPGSAGSTVQSIDFGTHGTMLASSGFILQKVTGNYYLTFGIFGDNTLTMHQDGGLGFATGNLGADLFLRRDAADTLAQRSGVNAQAFRIYNTYTDASNYERLELAWDASVGYLRFAKAGTGATRTIDIQSEAALFLGGSTVSFRNTAGTIRWQIDASGHLITPTADNTYDIGASGATRPRNLFVAGNVTSGATDFIHETSAALADGAGANTATMTNSPVTGNPTKWIAINDNGTTRYIPAW